MKNVKIDDLRAMGLKIAGTVTVLHDGKVEVDGFTFDGADLPERMLFSEQARTTIKDEE